MSGSRQRGGLPALAWAVLGVAAAAATICVVVIVVRFGALGVGPGVLFGALTALVAASWIWPIMMYSEGSSQAHHLDEGFFVVLVLVAAPLGTLVAFVAATLARRRPAVKTVFNLAQVVVSVGAGIAVVHGLAPPHPRLGAASLSAAALGAAVYFVVNSAAMAAILAATGAERMRAALLDGIGVRALLLAASVALGLVAALAASAYPVAGVLVVLPFLAFRQTLAGHFQARHDRARLLGLFDATLEVQSAIATGQVRSALTEATSRLLRARHVAIVPEPPADAALAARLHDGGTVRWLAVRGRSATEPLDRADGPLLDALAAVGSGALATSALYEDQERLEYHAFHDLLTGLPNRHIFLDRLQHALHRAERTGEVHAVLFVDIDRLKTTNDSLGHQTGDELLVGLAERLRLVTREGDTLARFGGDEFTLLLENVGGAAPAEAAARRVIDAVNAPLAVGGSRTINASVSVGIALASGGASPDGVLHDADVAMYQAKRRGGGSFELAS